MTAAWRLIKAKHAADAFSGEGARRAGGRWNSRGVPVVYASGSVALAVLELMVHVEDHALLQAFRVAEARFDEVLVEDVDRSALPNDWMISPPRRATQALGDQWVADARTPVLKVPSAVVPGWNYVLNPHHPEFEQIETHAPRPLRIDERLTD